MKATRFSFFRSWAVLQARMPIIEHIAHRPNLPRAQLQSTPCRDGTIVPRRRRGYCRREHFEARRPSEHI